MCYIHIHLHVYICLCKWYIIIYFMTYIVSDKSYMHMQGTNVHVCYIKLIHWLYNI